MKEQTVTGLYVYMGNWSQNTYHNMNHAYWAKWHLLNKSARARVCVYVCVFVCVCVCVRARGALWASVCIADILQTKSEHSSEIYFQGGKSLYVK